MLAAALLLLFLLQLISRTDVMQCSSLAGQDYRPLSSDCATGRVDLLVHYYYVLLLRSISLQRSGESLPDIANSPVQLSERLFWEPRQPRSGSQIRYREGDRGSISPLLPYSRIFIEH